MWSTDKHNVTFVIWFFKIFVGVHYSVLKQGTVMIREQIISQKGVISQKAVTIDTRIWMFP
jgi:hypothetical protein